MQQLLRFGPPYDSTNKCICMTSETTLDVQMLRAAHSVHQMSDDVRVGCCRHVQVPAKIFVHGTGDCGQLGLGEDVTERKRPFPLELEGRKVGAAGPPLNPDSHAHSPRLPVHGRTGPGLVPTRLHVNTRDLAETHTGAAACHIVTPQALPLEAGSKHPAAIQMLSLRIRNDVM